SLLEEATQRGVEVVRIGVGFGGPVDYRTGTVLLSHHVAGWENQPLKRILEDAFHRPVVVDNDCNAGALGEWRFGAGRGVDDLIYINIGTGIGGGVIAGGRLVRGVCNGAGEIGHAVIDPHGPVCTCGKRGCLEALCSGPYIALRAREQVKAFGAPTSLTATCTSEEVFAAALNGDALAQQIVQESAHYLAHAIGNAVSLLNPQMVILGGGVSEVGDVLLRPVRERVLHYCLPLYNRHLQIVPAQLGYDAGVRGAVALAIER
ncbi:MAG: ROK family protein, partial [Abditibacteriales bacterium]|nr:ROK family protein [Abditibacteriales bacterium]